MRGDTPASTRHDSAAGARWPWDSPFAWAFPPSRTPRSFLASLLARLRPPAGNHHAPPAQPAPRPAPPPRPARGSGIPLAQITSMDIPPHPPRPYVTKGGRRHAG